MPVETAQIWAEVLGWRIEEDGNNDEVALLPQPGNAETEIVPDILFLRVPEDRGVKNRLYLDLCPDDEATEVARLEALGATRVDVGQGGDVTWVVMADLEGIEFCVLRGRAAADGGPAPAVG